MGQVVFPGRTQASESGNITEQLQESHRMYLGLKFLLSIGNWFSNYDFSEFLECPQRLKREGEEGTGQQAIPI